MTLTREVGGAHFEGGLPSLDEAPCVPPGYLEMAVGVCLQVRANEEEEMYIMKKVGGVGGGADQGGSG